MILKFRTSPPQRYNVPPRGEAVGENQGNAKKHNTEMKTKYYLYAGYYELWISPKRLGAPLTPISRHKSLEAAERAAERYDEYATVIYDTELADDINTVDRCETSADQIADMAKYAA